MGEQGIFYDVFSTNKKEWDAEQWREHCRELGRAGRTKRQEANQRQWDIGYWLLAGAKHFKRVSISAGLIPGPLILASLQFAISELQALASSCFAEPSLVNPFQDESRSHQWLDP